MRAFELVDRKIIARVGGKVSDYYVEDMRVINGKGQFVLYNLNSHEVVIGVNELKEWSFVDTELEANVRKLSKVVKMYREMGLDEENPIIKEIIEKFDEAKKSLAEERKEKANEGRMDYHRDKLSVFYDIYHGKTIQRFYSRDEIVKLKEMFEKRDPFRPHQPLRSLQAFDADGNLVLDEWYR